MIYSILGLVFSILAILSWFIEERNDMFFLILILCCFVYNCYSILSYLGGVV